MGKTNPSTASKPGFWATLPGIFTGVAAVIGALGSAVVALYQAGIFTQKNELRAASNPMALTVARPLESTKEYRLGKGGGTPDTQHSPQLDEVVDFDAGGNVKMEFRLDNKACSKIRLNLSLDGRPLKQTDFFDERSGTLDLGQVSFGRHSLKLSPEGTKGGCNNGYLQSWGGTLTLYIPVER